MRKLIIIIKNTKSIHFLSGRFYQALLKITRAARSENARWAFLANEPACRAGGKNSPNIKDFSLWSK